MTNQYMTCDRSDNSEKKFVVKVEGQVTKLFITLVITIKNFPHPIPSGLTLKTLNGLANNIRTTYIFE